MKRKNKGLFVTFEGGEGAGKTTLISRVHEVLSTKGLRSIKTREPGGTPLGQRIRDLLLHEEEEAMSGRGELFLFLADRAHHVETVILPALEEGNVVLCDRFNDSTLAYQGVARHLDLKMLRSLCAAATNGLNPDLTFYLDLDPKIGLQRVRKESALDRLEKENLSFHQKVREGFLALAKEEPERVHVIDAKKEIEEVYQQVITTVETALCPT